MPKPSKAAEYTEAQTSLAERVLLEVWSRLGEYREYLVLIGGLAPRYMIDQSLALQMNNPHCGTMDVDLGVSIAVADLAVYKSIRRTLDEMGFRSGINERGNPQHHSFVSAIAGLSINIDFLTTIYGGSDTSLMRSLQDELRAIRIEGLGMALASPLKIKVTGLLLSGGLSTEVVNVCRPLPFVVLKALAFENRREPKDAYDLVYVLLNCTGNPTDVGAMAGADERKQQSFLKAVDVLQNRFSAIDRDGPVKYGRFIGNPNAQAVAFAAVQDFLRSLSS